jgi:hypothetical protein
MAQKLNGLWRGKIYAPLLQQPFSAAAISALPKGIKLLQRSADIMQRVAAAIEQPDSDCSPAPDAAEQLMFLQAMQQHNPAQMAASAASSAAELLSWLQAWPDLANALLPARYPSRLQIVADLLWRGASRMLMHLVQAVHKQAAADSGRPRLGPPLAGAAGALDWLLLHHRCARHGRANYRHYRCVPAAYHICNVKQSRGANSCMLLKFPFDASVLHQVASKQCLRCAH